MKLLILLTAMYAGVAPLQTQAQVPESTGRSTAPRIVSVRPDPAAPGFGETFDVLVTMRIPPATIAFLPDTLQPAEASQSIGKGEWRAEPTAGDSSEITMKYPVIGYREGLMDLPTLEFWLRDGASPAEAAARPAGAGVPQPADRVVMLLGAVMVPQFAEMSEAAVVVARPPADVIGGDWSVWILLALGVVSVAGVGGAGVVGARWWSAIGGALFGRSRRSSPRAVALRELERIRGLGWHRNGRVDEFYASSTDALRRFAAQIDPTWPVSLTSSELLGKLEDRFGPQRLETLAAVVVVAERAKFGTDRPEADAAEADWTTLRDWIRGAPES